MGKNLIDRFKGFNYKLTAGHDVNRTCELRD
jgi:hypothetical protein